MKKRDDATQETRAPRERISALSAAILRINASLDVDSVLREVVDSARVLTGARHGLIAATDERGEVQDFVTSGVEPEQLRAATEWPDGPRFFEHLHGLAAPLLLPDLDGYIRSLGYSPFPIPYGSFLAMPMRHRGLHAGVFFLGEKEGAFTGEDEEVLVLFASQAATALANARAHRAEQRARADLEALVETCPVGVVVFDAASARLLWFNQEARRIVAAVKVPGLSVAEMSDILTCRFADGREATLGEMRSSEQVRGEEIELCHPDGRSVRTLLHLTPVRPAGGKVETVVVTMQDLAPFEALERSRAEFMGMVSHELRAPLAAIKGSAVTVLGTARTLDTAELRQFFRIIDEQADRMDGLVGDLLEAGRIATGTLPVEPEPAEVAALVDRARTTFLGAGGRHAVLVDLPPDLPRVMADGRRIVQVLNNLFTNAARHSPQVSPIRVAAALDEAHVAVSVTDGGEGMTPERLMHLFRRHAGVGGGEGGGSGLGLLICKGLVEAHGGRIRAESAGAGRGTRVTFTLPLAGEAVEGAAAGAAGTGAHPPHQGRAGASVLVVDDDPQMLRYVRDTLSAAGYVPAVTGEAPEVSRLLETKRPDLVLLDLMLPGTDGIALMQSLPGLAELPVIFISAYGRDGDHREGAGGRRRRLHRQALLADGADGAGGRGAAQAPRTRAFRSRGAHHRPCAAPGERGGPGGAAHGHRVRAAAPALAQRGAGAHLRVPAAPVVGGQGSGQPGAGAQLREEAAEQAGRSRDGADLHRERARARLPDAGAGWRVSA